MHQTEADREAAQLIMNLCYLYDLYGVEMADLMIKLEEARNPE